MVRRSRDWKEGLSRRLSDPEYAQGFLRALIEDEEMDPMKALAYCVRARGVKEVAEQIEMLPANLQRVLREPQKAKVDTLQRVLAPFGSSVSFGFGRPRKRSLAHGSSAQKPDGV